MKTLIGFAGMKGRAPVCIAAMAQALGASLRGVVAAVLLAPAAVLVSPAAMLVSPAAMLVSPAAMASEGVRLDTAPIDQTDVISLQRGARTFVNYCLNCHSASLMRWNRLTDLGLNESQIKDNLIFTGAKVGDLMDVSFSKKDARKWFGAAPPDLSVIARARGADWLYSYLRGFYRDPSRPTGWNNTVYQNVAMPNPLWQLQGQRVRVEEPAKGEAGKEAKEGEDGAAHAVKYEMAVPGTQTPLQFDETVGDLVNFLVYMGEPAATSRKQIGIFVLLYLLALWPLVYMLKREYWKDVH